MYGTSSPNPMGGSSDYNSNPYSVRRPTGTPQKTTNNYHLTSPAQPQRPNFSTGASYALNGRVTSTTTSPSMPQRFPEPLYYSREDYPLANREVTQLQPGHYPDTPIPGNGVYAPASPQTPVRVTTQPHYLDTPIPRSGPQTTHSPAGPYVLANDQVKQTFSPASPCKERVVPPSYHAHREKMVAIREKHKSLLFFMEQLGCNGVSSFTEYFNSQFSSFMFPKEHRDLMLKMDKQFAAFYESFSGSDKIFFKLMRNYQTYENLVKKMYGPERQNHAEQLEELEKTLKDNEELVETRVTTLLRAFREFTFDLFSYTSRRVINNMVSASIEFRQLRAFYKKDIPPPATFAGMDYAYKNLLGSARKMRGLGWLDSLVRAALVDYSARNGGQYNNEPTSINVQWLNDWVKNKISFPFTASEEVEDALLKLKATIGCWDQLEVNPKSIVGTGCSFELFLRFNGMNTETIEYPLPGLNITPKLQEQFNKLNDEKELKGFVDDVKYFFDEKEKEGKVESKNPETCWKSSAPTNLKEKAVLIYSLKLTVPNAALVAEANELAKKIVSHIYTHELTNNQQ